MSSSDPRQTGTKPDFTAYGVDGCRKGWFYVAFAHDSKERCGIVPKIECLVNQVADGDRIFIDIPIGLLGRRRCDTEARQKLGLPRRCSVFPAPVRAVLEAETYEEAKRISSDKTGKGVSKQTFAISPKVKEVDDLLRNNPKAVTILREVHPEVCFWALAGRKPMEHSKKRSPGVNERLKVLSRHWRAAEEVYERELQKYPRKWVARDDILDAAVAALTAWQDTEVLRTLPKEPSKDDCDLPMQMVYVLREEARPKDLRS